MPRPPETTPAPREVRRASDFARDESGAAILEFALVLPILIALVFGCFEIGRALLVQQAMEQAVRAGARYLARALDPDCAPNCPEIVRHAIRMTTEQIVENTRAAASAVRVVPLPEPPPGTVVMTASMPFEVDFLGKAGVKTSWILTARHQEQRVAE